MCNKKQFKYCPSEIDECMKGLMMIVDRGLEHSFLTLVACCCGHKEYPMTIIIKDKLSGKVFDLISGKFIPRTRNFYKKDKKGYYYIPETLNKEEMS